MATCSLSATKDLSSWTERESCLIRGCRSDYVSARVRVRVANRALNCSMSFKIAAACLGSVSRAAEMDQSNDFSVMESMENFPTESTRILREIYGCTTQMGSLESPEPSWSRW